MKAAAPSESGQWQRLRQTTQRAGLGSCEAPPSLGWRAPQEWVPQTTTTLTGRATAQCWPALGSTMILKPCSSLYQHQWLALCSAGVARPEDWGFPSLLCVAPSWFYSSKTTMWCRKIQAWYSNGRSWGAGMEDAAGRRTRGWAQTTDTGGTLSIDGSPTVTWRNMDLGMAKTAFGGHKQKKEKVSSVWKVSPIPNSDVTCYYKPVEKEPSLKAC